MPDQTPAAAARLQRPQRRSKATPKQSSAYLVTSSNVSAMPVGEMLVDKGVLLVRDWHVMNFDTGEETVATGRRLLRLCPECRSEHSKAGVLDHDGECGSDAVVDKTRAALGEARKRIEATL